MKPTILRCWINQPSSRQRHHEHHGRVVLAEYPPDMNGCVRVHFFDGPLLSMEVYVNCLSLCSNTPYEQYRK